MSTNSIRVILADDHAVVRAGIRQFLEYAGDIEIVAEASDGLEAQRLIEQHLPDVAVLDIQMPQASGIEVTRWIRTNHRNVGVLVLTAYDDDPYVFAVLQAGANGYVLKTASPTDIIRAVRDVYSGKSVLDPAVTQKVMDRVVGQKSTFVVEELTERELEILRLVGHGFTNKPCAAGDQRPTVQVIWRIFNKLQLPRNGSCAGLLAVANRFAQFTGIIDDRRKQVESLVGLDAPDGHHYLPLTILLLLVTFGSASPPEFHA
jgi:DNA-binding NarL/FixJ family response regulator